MMQQYLNRRLVSNPPSGIRRIGQIAKSIPGCIALTIGEPDFDAPVSIRVSIAAAIAAASIIFRIIARLPSGKYQAHG